MFFYFFKKINIKYLCHNSHILYLFFQKKEEYINYNIEKK